MSSALMIYGARANIANVAGEHEAADTDMLREWLVHTDDLHLFEFAPPPPGVQAKAAFDWQGVLGTGADVLAFGGLLWAAYERFVKPRRMNRRSMHEPYLYIVVKHPDGHRIEFQLGTTHTDQTLFVEQFLRTVSEFRATEPQHDTETLVSHISESHFWLRISIRNESASKPRD